LASEVRVGVGVGRGVQFKGHRIDAMEAIGIVLDLNEIPDGELELFMGEPQLAADTVKLLVKGRVGELLVGGVLTPGEGE
jgi:hypothetical protein